MNKIVKYGVQASVLAAIVGGSLVWVHSDKSVLVKVDGENRRVHTTAGSVRGVLTDAGYAIGSHDIVAPPPSASVDDGSEIVLRRGRLIQLDVDGKRTEVWTTAPTVDEALGQLGYSALSYSSVSRSDRLPVGPTKIRLRTPKRVTVIADGTTRTVTSTASTVAALLTEARVALDADDTSAPVVSTPLRYGQRIVVTRIKKVYLTRTTAVPYPTTIAKDGSLTIGTSKVVRNGVTGSLQSTYLYLYVNGKLASTTLTARKTLKAMVGRIVAVGTRPPPNTPAGNQAIASSLLGSYGFGQNQMSCLINMWNRESGWNARAANPSGAYGIPQSLPGSKMASVAGDWRTNPTTQIKWGLGYIKARYGTPCGAWSFWQNHNYY